MTANPMSTASAALLGLVEGVPADLVRNQSGAVAIVAALAFPVLAGGMGLGAEVGYWYLKERKLQHAADVAAQAAGVRLNRGDPKPKLDAAAINVAKHSGFKADRGTITVNWPPLSGPGAGDKTQVEVVLTETVPRAFSTLFIDSDVKLRGRAVAKVNGEKICSLALNPTAGAALQSRPPRQCCSRTASSRLTQRLRTLTRLVARPASSGIASTLSAGLSRAAAVRQPLKVCGTVRTSSPPIVLIRTRMSSCRRCRRPVSRATSAATM
jgi:Flp pilus assembly protein TadG